MKCSSKSVIKFIDFFVVPKYYCNNNAVEILGHSLFLENQIFNYFYLKYFNVLFVKYI